MHSSQISEDKTIPKSQIDSATNWAAASFLGILIPILGLIFGVIADNKAAKILDIDPSSKEAKRAKKTAAVGMILSALVLIAGVYWYFSEWL